MAFVEYVLCWLRLRRLKRGSTMPTLLEDWKAHRASIIQSAEKILRADVTITDKGFGDPKFLALAMLIRTVSNLKGGMILLDARRIVEARTLARSCLENLYWTVGLYEEGDKFVRQMRDDELKYRKAAGQAIFASGATLDDDADERLRKFMRDVAKLWSAGYALGASFDNTLVVNEDRLLNPDGLRFPDEFARHKALDAIGDLALAGAPLLGAYRSVRGGHKLNHAVLSALMADPSAWVLVEGPELRPEIRPESRQEAPRRAIRGHADLATGLVAPAYGPDVS